MKKTMIFSVLVLLGMVTSLSVRAQDTDEKAMVSQLVAERNYIFRAETALPTTGRTRQLTTEYDLVVSGDSVVAFLPYFGRAYVAPINSSEGGIKFTSTEFKYTSKPAKRDGWEITITPADAGTVQQLYLTIFENGRATLRVNDRNRQNISFNGYVVKGKERVKKGF